MANIVLGIDAGHGMPDPGAVNGALKEYKLTAAIVSKLTIRLQNSFKIVLSRTGDNGLVQSEKEDLDARCKIFNDAGVDFILSVHINAGGGRGPEVYVIPGATAETLNKASIINRYLATLWGFSRGVKAKNLKILRDTKAPAVLVECGFIDNMNDAAWLSTDAFLERIAEALADALFKIFGIKKEGTLFQDVNPSDWFYNSIFKVAKAGIMHGYPDGSFKPDQPPSRAEMAAALDKLLTYLKGENWYAS